jgi:hypothetical protein
MVYLLKGLGVAMMGEPYHNGTRLRRTGDVTAITFHNVMPRSTQEYRDYQRLPAAELESAVLDQLRVILRSPELIGEALPQAVKLDPALDEAKVIVAMTRLDAIWDQLFPAEQARIVKLLVEKVIVSPSDLEVRLRANGIEKLVLEMSPKPIE